MGILEKRLWLFFYGMIRYKARSFAVRLPEQSEGSNDFLISDKKILIILFSFIFSITILPAQTFSIKGQIIQSNQASPIERTTILIKENKRQTKSDERGIFQFSNLRQGIYHLLFYKEGLSSETREVKIIDQDITLMIVMDTLGTTLKAVEIESEKQNNFGIRRLRNVEGMAIYAAKKTEVISLDNIVGNLATNNARQVYKGIAGLNIWENDGSGLQLNIGARGLDPNRTSSFNARQNGYDISADALGYPESYYTPPTQALSRIEVVRGAASLQYGPQFGGLLNFIFKKGNTEKVAEFTTENTLGSFGLFSTFNSIGGQKKGLNYYGFFQHKRGNGWRPNSGFKQNTAFVSFTQAITPKLKIGGEFTHMNYLAQQPGGLQDFEFRQDARQSNRNRNWFAVDWNLAALTLDFQINDQTKLNTRNFFLSAQRDALGELGPINRPDPLRERDLIRGKYRNFGNETRLIHRYQIKNQVATFLAGFRYYQGFSRAMQGNASDGSDADFRFLNPLNLERSSYEFPSRNVSLFAENLFYIKDKWTITPGARFEYIRTASEGYFKERVFSGGQVIFENTIEESRNNERSFVLLGIGIGHKIKKSVELYANFSQNYRSINFSDLAVVNPNLIVDSLLKDETGFNADFGVRGNLCDGRIRFDAGLFHLLYQDRIGVGEIVISDPIVVEKAVAYRTNIGDARIVGLEAYAEADIWRLIRGNDIDVSLSIFSNVSFLHGRYLTGMSNFVGNEVELIPPFSLKTGINFFWKNLKASWQYSYVAQHFTDATNAVLVPDATRGIIPTYSVQDFSISYSLSAFNFQFGVNNLLDARYFTRRATAYPGPGIIPADGRSFYGGIGLSF